MSQSNLPVIFLMGPTASGKTDLAMALREHLPVELVSVDSALVYRGMDIGSAKPSKEELLRVPHQLIDIRDPSEPYSAADFCADAEREIAAIHAQQKIPLLVGGTMLYFKALLDGLAEMPEADAEVRAEIEREAAEFGWPFLHQRLAEVDPEMAAEIHPNHSQRLSRALEVYRISGKTMTELRRAQLKNQSASFVERFNLVQIAIAPRNRAVLHERIERRFHKMLSLGLIGEVRTLFERKDLHEDLPAIRAVGYRQVWDYLAGRLTYDQMVDRGIIATRQLAKRQFTWLKSWDNNSDNNPDINSDTQLSDSNTGLKHGNSSLNWLYTETEFGNSLSQAEIVRCALNFVHDAAI